MCKFSVCFYRRQTESNSKKIPLKFRQKSLIESYFLLILIPVNRCNSRQKCKNIDLFLGLKRSFGKQTAYAKSGKDSQIRKAFCPAEKWFFVH